MAQLNDDQTREIARDKKIIEYISIPANTTIANTYDPFKEELQELKDNVDAVLLLAPEKEQTGKGVTETKKDYKREFADLAGLMFLITRGYAAKTGNKELAAQVKSTTEDIFAFKDGNILSFAKNFDTEIYTPALRTDPVFMKYKITDAMITQALGFATEVDKRIGVAQSIEASSDAANTEINNIINKIHKNVDMLNTLVAYFLKAYPKFVAGYKISAHKDDTGVRHTGAQFTILADGIPSEELGSVTIGKKTVTPDLVGSTKPIYCRGGNRKVIAKYPGKPDKEFIHYFITREVEKITIEF